MVIIHFRFWLDWSKVNFRSLIPRVRVCKGNLDSHKVKIFSFPIPTVSPKVR